MSHVFGKAYAELFLPPVNRAMRVLDRSFFRKTIPLTAMDVYQRAQIARVKRECKRDILDVPRIDPEVKVQIFGEDRHLWLLRPGIKYNDPSTLSKQMKPFFDGRRMELRPYELNLEYDHWTYDEILSAILPEDLGAPVRSFEPVGHVGNMILEPKFHPYRHLIASVLLDKTRQHKTVVMKPTNVELMEKPSITPPPLEYLAGDPNTTVELAASKCMFRFDYSKTHWDSTMSFLNKTLIERFKEKQAVADIMAGVGLVAIPTAKKRIFVFANDADLETYKALSENITKNRVPDFCRPFNHPPRDFIRIAIEALAARSRSEDTNKVYIPLPHVNPRKPPPPPRIMKVPTVFSDFIINARAGGTSLLSAFRGAYRGLRIENNDMPMIHVYVHGPSGGLKDATAHVCEEISKGLGYNIEASDLRECVLAIKAKPVAIYRAGFRLPRKVAFGMPSRKEAREREGGEEAGGRGDS